MSNSSHLYVPCPLDTCAIEWSTIGYQPNLGANAFFLAVFVLTLIAQIACGITLEGTKTWTYLLGIGGGLVLEIVGYVTRVMLHAQPLILETSYN